MVDENKVKETLHYFNIDCEIDSVYGNWAVTQSGDVVNYLYSYAILTIHYYDCNWLEKLKAKVWFKPECEAELSKALRRANEIISERV